MVSAVASIYGCPDVYYVMLVTKETNTIVGLFAVVLFFPPKAHSLMSIPSRILWTFVSPYINTMIIIPDMN